jgi:small subunit ribosomal protein S20
MPITSSAKKALRQSGKKRVYNMRRKGKVDAAVKQIQKLIAAGKGAEAKKLLPEAQSAIDKAVKGNTLKKNTASRRKARLAALVKKVK